MFIKWVLGSLRRVLEDTGSPIDKLWKVIQRSLLFYSVILVLNFPIANTDFFLIKIVISVIFAGLNREGILFCNVRGVIRIPTPPCTTMERQEVGAVPKGKQWCFEAKNQGRALYTQLVYTTKEVSLVGLIIHFIY